MIDGRCSEPSQHANQEEPTANGRGCGCSSKNKPSEDEILDNTLVRSEADADHPEGDPIDLGIRYGRCYHLNLQDDNRQVGSNRENAVYTPGGLFHSAFVDRQRTALEDRKMIL
jgi:hypothetical protein